MRQRPDNRIKEKEKSGEKKKKTHKNPIKKNENNEKPGHYTSSADEQRWFRNI